MSSGAAKIDGFISLRGSRTKESIFRHTLTFATKIL